MNRIDNYGAYAQMNSMYEPNKSKETKETNRPEKIHAAKSQSAVELSDNAKKLLEELKEKYGNADFMIANYETDEEAQRILSRGTKEYSVLIDPQTLEKMAADEETKATYMGMIDQATSAMSDMKEQLKETGKENDLVHVGVSIAEDGTMEFFAHLKESNEAQKERLEDAKEAKEEQKKMKQKMEKRATLKAGSIEELIEKIKAHDWSKISSTETIEQGAKIDLKA